MRVRGISRHRVQTTMMSAHAAARPCRALMPHLSRDLINATPKTQPAASQRSNDERAPRVRFAQAIIDADRARVRADGRSTK